MSSERVTSAMPTAERRSEPAKMTSSDLRDRRARPCSPSAQRRASARLLLPEPFGPTTALIPGPSSTTVRSANDLNPCSRSDARRAARVTAAAAGRRLPGGRAGGPASGRSEVPRSSSVAIASRGGRGLGDPARLALPDAEVRSSRTTEMRKVRRWSGPLASSRRYSGRTPYVRWAISCSRLFGLFRLASGRSAPISGRRRASKSHARDGVAAVSRGRRPPRRPRRRPPSSAGRRRPLICASPSPSSRYAPRSMRAASRARPAAELTIAARRADRTPSSSAGWRAKSACGDGEVDDRVAEELEPLVVAGAPRPGARGSSCCGRGPRARKAPAPGR